VTRLPLFTGSGVARALACPPSTILPQSDEDPSADTTARDAGSTVHRFIERTGELMAAHFLGHAEAARRALAEIPEGTPGRDACEALDVGALPFDLGNASIELALAYDYVTDTARVLHDANGNVIRERRYADAVPALRESEVPMTLDAVEYDGGHAIVTDVKTGQPHAGYEARSPSRGCTRSTCRWSGSPDSSRTRGTCRGQCGGRSPRRTSRRCACGSRTRSSSRRGCAIVRSPAAT
jgi:hypothetical protein